MTGNEGRFQRIERKLDEIQATLPRLLVLEQENQRRLDSHDQTIGHAFWVAVTTVASVGLLAFKTLVGGR